jgi:hypothetical protein
MDDNSTSTPPEQRTALLPIEKLKQLYFDEGKKYRIEEFRWKGRAAQNV